MLSFKPTVSLSSFTLLKRLFWCRELWCFPRVRPYVRELWGSHQGCQVPFCTSGWNVGLLLIRCSGQGPHLAMSGEPRGFSRVAAGFSSYDGDFRLPIVHTPHTYTHPHLGQWPELGRAAEKLGSLQLMGELCLSVPSLSFWSPTQSAHPCSLIPHSPSQLPPASMHLPGHLLRHTWLVLSLKELLGSLAEGAAGVDVPQ